MRGLSDGFDEGSLCKGTSAAAHHAANNVYRAKIPAREPEFLVGVVLFQNDFVGRNLHQFFDIGDQLPVFFDLDNHVITSAGRTT
jgi:hypothetical protein